MSNSDHKGGDNKGGSRGGRVIKETGRSLPPSQIQIPMPKVKPTKPATPTPSKK
jgi:hypothetical protein